MVDGLQLGHYNINPMYPFQITGTVDGTYRFQLEGITIICQGYTKENGKHLMKQPARSIAFFAIQDYLYSIANNTKVFKYVEDLYEQLRIQYSHFIPGGASFRNKSNLGYR